MSRGLPLSWPLAAAVVLVVIAGLALAAGAGLSVWLIVVSLNS